MHTSLNYKALSFRDWFKKEWAMQHLCLSTSLRKRFLRALCNSKKLHKTLSCVAKNWQWYLYKTALESILTTLDSIQLKSLGRQMLRDIGSHTDVRTSLSYCQVDYEISCTSREHKRSIFMMHRRDFRDYAQNVCDCTTYSWYVLIDR